jgi:hypothetical protein
MSFFNGCPSLVSLRSALSNPEPDKIAADTANVSNLAVKPGVGRRNVDAVVVNARSNVQGARFVDGPSPCKSATT